MNISISPQSQKKIESLIASGRFNTPQEVIEEALELIVGDDNATGSVHSVKDVEQGISDLLEGRYIVMRDSVDLGDFFTKKRANRQSQ